MVQRARQARGDMMKSLKLAYQKVDSEMKSMLGTRINTRHVSLMVLFAFSLALLRRDATIFISILTAINTLYLVAGNGVIDIKETDFLSVMSGSRRRRSNPWFFHPCCLQVTDSNVRILWCRIRVISCTFSVFARISFVLFELSNSMITLSNSMITKTDTVNRPRRREKCC